MPNLVFEEIDLPNNKLKVCLYSALDPTNQEYEEFVNSFDYTKKYNILVITDGGKPNSIHRKMMFDKFLNKTVDSQRKAQKTAVVLNKNVAGQFVYGFLNIFKLFKPDYNISAFYPHQQEYLQYLNVISYQDKILVKQSVFRLAIKLGGDVMYKNHNISQSASLVLNNFPF